MTSFPGSKEKRDHDGVQTDVILYFRHQNTATSSALVRVFCSRADEESQQRTQGRTRPTQAHLL
jgi:hypothetical protein